MPSHPILVTGAAGFIGSHVCEELVARGHRVIGIDDLSTGQRSNLDALAGGNAFHLLEGDICEPGLLDKIVAKEEPGSVVHLAALVSVPLSIEDPELNFRLNLEGTHRVLEAARIGDVRGLVLASSAAIYGDVSELPISEASPARPLSPYGAAKQAGESLLCAYAAAYGMAATALRFFNVYGPRQDPSSPYSGVISIFAERIAAGQPLTIHGNGEQCRDFVFVKDLARAVAEAALSREPGYRVANLCTGTPTTLLDLIEELRKVTGQEVEVRHAAARAGDIRRSLGSVAAFEELFGWVPATPIGEGLEELLSGDATPG